MTRRLRRLGVFAVLAFTWGCSGDGPPPERSAQADGSGSSASVVADAASQTESDVRRNDDGQIVTDTFLIDHAWDGDDLLLAIRSDLPPTTTVMVGVDRYYWEQGSSDAYSLPYVSEKSTIGAWEGRRHRVPVKDGWWRDSLQAHQRMMARVGMPYDVRTIGDSVHVSFTVPVHQFGRWNENLAGEAVRTEGLRVVEEELALAKPIGQAPPPSPWVSRTDLRPGRTYVLGGPVPLIPACNPGSAEETMRAIEQVYNLGTGTAITVEEVVEEGCPEGSDLSYRVEVLGPDGARVDDGWISSIALIGQDIRRRGAAR